MFQDQGPPNPVEHAAVVLEVCNGCIEEACEICLTNMRADRAAGFRYWQTVLRSLTVVGEA